MTCRVARSFPNDIQLEPVTCGECGSTELHPKQGGHVCPIYTQTMLEHRARKREDLCSVNAAEDSSSVKSSPN